MEVSVYDVPAMYCEVLSALKTRGVEEASRNGRVLSIQEPLVVTVQSPWKRVLHDEQRNANPFFHVMEFVWMMAGRADLEWIQQFNSGFKAYADEDGEIHGAYGARWRHHFGYDQLAVVAKQLREDQTCRRAVLTMWDGYVDLGTEHNDIPCNTQIYLRCIDNSLDMTVLNRSNDVVWGMCGANAVHMTMLHELLAHAVGVNQGVYRVVSNNAHIYEQHWPMLKPFRVPARVDVEALPLLQEEETMEEFARDCGDFCFGKKESLRTQWMRTVALPIYCTYRHNDEPWVHKISCPQWRIACVNWLYKNRL